MLTELQPLQALLIILALIIGISTHFLVKWRSRTRGRPLPPGPRGLPLVGNLFNAPKFKPWIGYRDLSLTYGSMVYLSILGQSIVVLNTADVIDELLEKRSAITSDRKDSVLIELTGQDMTLTFHPYGQRWREHRRLFWQNFTPRAIMEYRTVQRDTAQEFLALLLRDPAHFKDHIRYTLASSMLKILYDIHAVDANDRYISNVTAALESIAQGLVPGKFMVEFFPWLRHVPAWMPGANFQRRFAEWRAAGLALKNEPFAYTKDSLELEGDTNPSVVGRLLVNGWCPEGASVEEAEDIIKNVGAVAFEGGSDTTASALQTVFLAASLYPQVVDRARAELDAVVGPHRLPDFDDQESLVFVSAMIKEALRWQNVVPLAVPHRLIRDDEYHGYFLPEGTLLLANTWACMHDPEVYPNPDTFNPERFIRDGKLDPSIRDPAKFAFGYGRRICPGRHFAEASLFITVASVLHTFDITPPLDEHGQPIKSVLSMTDGLISFPEDVRCVVKPRSPWAEALIMGQSDRLGSSPEDQTRSKDEL